MVKYYAKRDRESEKRAFFYVQLEFLLALSNFNWIAHLFMIALPGIFLLQEHH